MTIIVKGPLLYAAENRATIDGKTVLILTLKAEHGWPFEDYDRLLAAWKTPADDRVPVVDLLPLLPGPYYMDPPDGGDVPVLEQLRRMSQDAAKWRALLPTQPGAPT